MTIITAGKEGRDHGTVFRDGKIGEGGSGREKGQNIKVIDIRQVSVMADYFIIADGSNVNQVQAMVDSVEEALGKAGYPCKQIEGYRTGGWILMDYGDIIVHAFCREDRLFYDLERIWRDGKLMDESELE